MDPPAAAATNPAHCLGALVQNQSDARDQPCGQVAG
jgi:hypothetical protein